MLAQLGSLWFPDYSERLTLRLADAPAIGATVLAP
jgi:hypothetical protein